MKGSVFDNLAAIKDVGLRRNECINEKFETEEEIRGISKTVSGACDKNGTQIACEEITNYGDYVACSMITHTTIRDISYTILDPSNYEVEIMDLRNNRNIEFLPISPHQTFPNLMSYYAANCSIKEISKRNFEGLVHLRDVILEDNQIYFLLSDAFKELVSLLYLYLGKFEFSVLDCRFKLLNMILFV